MEVRVKQPTNNPEYYKTLLQMQEQGETLKAKQGYFKAYIFSVIMPPIGLYYFFKYFFFLNESYNDRKAGLICLFLTIASLVLNIWLIQLFLSQFETPQNQDLNSIKELITPQNLKDLRQLIE